MDWSNVEVHPKDQPNDSFDEAIVLWFYDCCPNNSFRRQCQWMAATYPNPFLCW